MGTNSNPSALAVTQYFLLLPNVADPQVSICKLFSFLLFMFDFICFRLICTLLWWTCLHLLCQQRRRTPGHWIKCHMQQCCLGSICFGIENLWCYFFMVRTKTKLLFYTSIQDCQTKQPPLRQNQRQRWFQLRRMNRQSTHTEVSRVNRTLVFHRFPKSCEPS